MSIKLFGKNFIFTTHLFTPAKDILTKNGSVIHQPGQINPEIEQCYNACLNITEGRYQVGDFTRVQIGIVNGWLVEQKKEA